MTRPRSVVLVGAALPVVLLVAVGYRAAVAYLGTDASASESAVPVSQTSAPLGTPSDPAERRAAVVLRQAVLSVATASFSGRQVVSSWYASGSASRMVRVSQDARGVRDTELVGTTGPAAASAAASASVDEAGAGPTVVSDRALDALIDAYDLRVVGPAKIAGRAATVVEADRAGRVRARLWIDDRTGVLLRQDVLDGTGRLERTTAFVDLSVPAVPSAPSAPKTGTASLSPWREAVPVTSLAGWRARGWPCPVQLPGGYALLDARQARAADGARMLHLTYGDGLSAVSVFVQRGRLDGDRLAGWRSEHWRSGEVRVRTGDPELMVWQGGDSVITAVGEVDEAQLRTSLAGLPGPLGHGGPIGAVRDGVQAGVRGVASLMSGLPG